MSIAKTKEMLIMVSKDEDVSSDLKKRATRAAKDCDAAVIKDVVFPAMVTALNENVAVIALAQLLMGS